MIGFYVMIFFIAVMAYAIYKDGEIDTIDTKNCKNSETELKEEEEL